MAYSIFLPGEEKPNKVGKLIGLTGIESEPVIDALTDHLVNGSTITAAAALNGVDSSNLRRALIALESKARLVEEIKDIDWPDYREGNLMLQATRMKKVS